MWTAQSARSALKSSRREFPWHDSSACVDSITTAFHDGLRRTQGDVLCTRMMGRDFEVEFRSMNWHGRDGAGDENLRVLIIFASGGKAFRSVFLGFGQYSIMVLDRSILHYLLLLAS